MKISETPKTLDCPACKKSDSLLVALDVTHYYRVEDITETTIKGASTGETESFPETDIRLFCTWCGEYFEVPDHYELNG